MLAKFALFAFLLVHGVPSETPAAIAQRAGTFESMAACEQFRDSDQAKVEAAEFAAHFNGAAIVAGGCIPTDKPDTPTAPNAPAIVPRAPAVEERGA